MISKILVPIDGSETARKATKYAVEMAKQTGATVTLLYVINKSSLVSQSVPSVATPTHLTEPIEDYLRQVADACLEDAEKIGAEKGVESIKVIRTGHPVEEIIKEADKSRTDLIIMGSHGKSALEAAVLGSVTDGVIHTDTKAPVLVVRR